MRVGLVLSGAMAKGAYELGALQAISEYFPPEKIPYISTTSIGTLTGYAYSCGKLDTGFQLWRDMNKQYSKLFVKTVLDSDYFRDVVSSIAKEKAVAKRFYTSLLNVSKRKSCYKNLIRVNHDRRETYMLAAMAFTPLVKPVKIGGDNYIDGAFADNIPIYPLTRIPLDYVICIHFDKYDYTFESHVFDKKIIKIVFTEENTILRKSIWITREDTEQMLDDGYKKTKRVLDYVFSDGVDCLDTIYDKIEFLNSLKPKKKMRLTGDIVFNNITKFTRQIAKSEIME